MRAVNLATTLVLLVATPSLAQYGQTTNNIETGFLPVESPDCAARHSCLYWEYCIGNEINHSGIGQLDVRTFKPIPADVLNPKCPGQYSVCCYIPDELWEDIREPGVWAGECPIHQTCVPNYQCIGDVINTSGALLIDIRAKPKSECTNQDPRYKNVPGKCCKLPFDPLPVLQCESSLSCLPNNLCSGNIPKGPNGRYTDCYTNTLTAELGVCCNAPAPEPLRICPLDQLCVTREQCTSQGQVNTDGSGILNPRVHAPCYLSEGTGTAGVCCNPPPVEVVDTCPGGGSHSCTNPEFCRGTNLLDTYGNPLKCNLNPGQADGFCCEGPEPVYFCDNNDEFFCTTNDQCLGQKLLNNYGNDQKCYIGGVQGSTGICCESAKPVTTCAIDSSSFCTAVDTCSSATDLIQDVYGNTQTCYYDGGVSVGHCCLTPKVDDCTYTSADTICEAVDKCTGTIVLNAYSDPQLCGLATGALGICCTPPPTLPTCSATYTCNHAERCQGYYEDPNSVLGLPDCYIGDTHVQGKCCNVEPPAKIIRDECPIDSVCLPDLLCQGTILNAADNFVSYDTPNSEWQLCELSGSGLINPGVCCKNAITVPELPPAAGQCGVRNVDIVDSRIQNVEVQSYQAQFAEFPWMAILFYTNFTFKCGASLINDRWIVTGAHCVNGLKPTDLKVRLGEWKVDSYDEPGNYLDVDIEYIYSHDEFNSGNLHKDIALLQLYNAVPFQFHINAICLPSPGQQFYGVTRCFSTGWGKDAFDGGVYQAIMKKVDLPLVEHSYCQDSLRQTRLGQYFVLDESFLCAGGEAGKDACQGDGGGPLACQDPNTGRYVLTGITAWGIGCGQENVPGVYADVAYFLPWIEHIIYGTPLQASEPQTNGGQNYGKK